MVARSPVSHLNVTDSSTMKAPVLSHPKLWWPLAKSAAAAWLADFAPSMGAALSYYTIFSIAPLLLIVISVAGLVFGADAARGEIFGQLRGMMGADAAAGVEGLLTSVSKPSQGIIATVVGLVVLLIGATTVFGELQDSLDRIWRAPMRDKSGGLWGLLRTRLLSFGMILGIAFLLMVSLVSSAALSALGKWWAPLFGGWEVLANVVNFIFSFGFVTVVFAMIYKIMPRASVQWVDVWIGSAVTSLMFTVGKFLIGLYIGTSGVASAYGAAGSLVVVLVWVYYSAQVFLLGAEFTWVYAKTYGSMRDVAPSGDANAPGGSPAPVSPGHPAASGSQAGAVVTPGDGSGAVPLKGLEAGASKESATPSIADRWLRRAGMVVGVGIAVRLLIAAVTDS